MENGKWNEQSEQRTYYLRGMGVLCLVALLFAAGMWRFGEGSMPVSSTIGRQRTPLSYVNTETKSAALTFDGDTTSGDVREILTVLDEYRVKASFFVTGEWAENNQNLLKQIVAAGHDLGNHGYRHINMKDLTEAEKSQEIQALHKLVKEVTGQEMSLFRPPYGAYDEAVLTNAQANGYRPVCWAVDSMDWKDYQAESIAVTVRDGISLNNGSIVRFHVDGKNTVAALRMLIPRLQEEGWELLSVSQLTGSEKN